MPIYKCRSSHKTLVSDSEGTYVMNNPCQALPEDMKGRIFSFLVQIRYIVRLQYQLRKLLPWVSVGEKDTCHVTPQKDPSVPCSVEADR